MDIVITTSDPEAVDTAEIQAAVEGLGYFVASVQIVARVEVAEEAGDDERNDCTTLTGHLTGQDHRWQECPTYHEDDK